MKTAPDPEFGATGQFEPTGVFVSDRKADPTFATTLGLDRLKSLVLLGAGDAHLQVLQLLARQPRTDVDVTLVTPWSHKTHAALAQGHVAGLHPLAACQIDLQPWLRASGVRWLPARCSGLDAAGSTLLLDHTTPADAQWPGMRPALLKYDLLSIDTGTTQEHRRLDAVLPGAAEHAALLKPTETWLTRWAQALQHHRSQPCIEVWVIGAHTLAVEWALALARGLTQGRRAHRVHLVGQGVPLAADQPRSVAQRLHRRLQHQGVAWHPGHCTRVAADHLEMESEGNQTAHLVLMTLGDHPPQWLARSGLATDALGRVLVTPQLHSPSHPKVFAAGSVAALARPPHAALAGARVGHGLGLNLLASLTDQPLTNHRPSGPGLSFVDCGGGHAIARWGRWSAEGPWAWRWKRRLDFQQVARFQR